MLLVQTACSDGLPAPITLHSDDWGNYQVQTPHGPVKRLVFAFGAAADPELDASVRAVAARGAMVARVDVGEFAAGVLDRDEPCLDLAGIVNWHANYLGRRFAFADLAPPLIIGHSTGAGLAYVLLVQAPPLTFAGAITDAPARQLALSKPLCGISSKPIAAGKITLRPAPIGAPWQITGAASDNALVAAVMAKSPAGLVQVLPSGSLAEAASNSFNAQETAARHATAVADLPLVEVPVKHPTDTLAVIYSGDGGWRDIDRTIGGLLADKGIPVVGIDSVRYFWHRRSPEQMAMDLARLLNHYQKTWGSQRVVLIGYSFGADILPFAYNRLPRDWQDKVVLVTLLAPARGADFEVSVSGWLGQSNTGTNPTLPELQRMPPAKVLCVYGAREQADSLCTAPGLARITRLQRPGDHHFDRRYDIIVDAIRDRLASFNNDRHS